MKPLDDVASILAHEPKEFSEIIKRELRSGLPYPKAREIAMQMYFGNSNVYKDVLSKPNNILGVEYLKALKRSNSHIVPLTIKREEADYNSKTAKGNIASATAIRDLICNKKSIHKYVPTETYEILERLAKQGQLIPSLKVFEKEIIYSLRKMTMKELSSIPDVGEGLDNKIKIAISSCNTIDEFIARVKSKQITQTRIQRILLYALLGITDKDMTTSRRITPYIRVLGFNNHGKRIISAIAEHNPRAKIVVSVKRFLENNHSPSLTNMMSKDILASNIYTLAYKTNPVANLDYTHKILEMK